MRRVVTTGTLVLLGLLVGIPRAVAQSYGLGLQTTTLGAASFRAAAGNNSAYNYDLAADGYLHGNGDYLAPLELPEGAEIVGLCADVYSITNGGMGVRLEAIQLPADGLVGDVYPIPAGEVIINALSIGFQSWCNQNPLSYVVRSRADVGSGVRNLAYRVTWSSFDAALGAVRIQWRRQVSPAPDTPTFGDVPASDGAFAFIEALVASGVTAGCGGGNYCPDSPITRRQMAVFLSKALGMHWAN